jgi:DNA-binding transcriptional regulator GbsR (MarR family)
MKQIQKIHHPSVPPEVLEFATQVGNFIEYWGFKNVQGQIWAYLFLSEDPLDTGELIRRTRISKGLASIYLKEMLEFDVIQEAGTGSHGTTFYQANPNQDAVIFNVLRKRERLILSRVEAAWRQCQELPKSEIKQAALSVDRIKIAGELIQDASTILDLFIKSQKTIHFLVKHLRSVLK